MVHQKGMRLIVGKGRDETFFKEKTLGVIGNEGEENGLVVHSAK